MEAVAGKRHPWPAAHLAQKSTRQVVGYPRVSTLEIIGGILWRWALQDSVVCGILRDYLKQIGMFPRTLTALHQDYRTPIIIPNH